MIQYFHDRDSNPDYKGDYYHPEGTVAIDMVTKTDLERMFISHSNQIVMPIGLTIKSKKDIFVKKEGRSAAVKNLTLQVVELFQVKQQGTRHIYELFSKIEHNKNVYHVTFKLTTVAESEKVSLITGEISYDYR